MNTLYIICETDILHLTDIGKSSGKAIGSIAQCCYWSSANDKPIIVYRTFVQFGEILLALIRGGKGWDALNLRWKFMKERS